MEQIEVTISDSGVEINATGFKDKSCLKELDTLLHELKKSGITPTVTDQRLKPEGRVNKPELKNVVEYR